MLSERKHCTSPTAQRNVKLTAQSPPTRQLRRRAYLKKLSRFQNPICILAIQHPRVQAKSCLTRILGGHTGQWQSLTSALGMSWTNNSWSCKHALGDGKWMLRGRVNGYKYVWFPQLIEHIIPTTIRQNNKATSDQTTIIFHISSTTTTST